jgi:hypothetical protein
VGVIIPDMQNLSVSNVMTETADNYAALDEHCQPIVP